MKWIFRTLLVVIMALSVFTSLPTPSYAQDYATCDGCGFCKNTIGDSAQGYVLKGEYIIPGNWEQCRKCLYPATTNSNNPLAKETLVVNADTGFAPTPQPGAYFTMIGCVNSDLGSFRQTGAAASVVQVFLNTIFSVAGGIGFLYVIYSSFLMVTARGDVEKLSYAKRQFSAAIIGVVIALGAVFLVNMLASNVLRIPGFS